MLDDALASLLALWRKLLGHFDFERRLIRRIGPRIARKVRPGLERLANDFICGGVYNTDIGHAGVRSLNFKLHGHSLSSMVLLDVASVVRELVALALPLYWVNVLVTASR